MAPCGSFGAFIWVFAIIQAQELRTADAMVKKLAHGSFAERNLADAWLRQRPFVGPSLERASQTSDLETKRRIGGILDFHVGRRVRALETAVDHGEMERAIQLLSMWPTGKHEDAAWAETCRLSQNIISASHKVNDKLKFPSTDWAAKTVPHVISERFADRLNAKKLCFVRGGDLLVRGPKNTLVGIPPLGLDGPVDGPAGAWLVCSGSVTLLATGEIGALSSGAVFAHGRITVRGNKNGSLLVVGADDVTLDTVSNSIIIARGKVTCDFALHCHIIAGKTVTVKNGLPVDCAISENDRNPLGYIRWSERAK